MLSAMLMARMHCHDRYVHTFVRTVRMYNAWAVGSYIPMQAPLYTQLAIAILKSYLLADTVIMNLLQSFLLQRIFYNLCVLLLFFFLWL